MLANETIYQEAEQLVLAALMTEKNAFYRVNDLLRPEMFSVDVHREVPASRPWPTRTAPLT